MKHIGLIGGLSWESTALYYQLINQRVRERRGGLHSAPVLLHSLDFQPIAQLQRTDNWGLAAAVLVDAALRLQRAGAELLVICSNTMHEVAPQVAAASSIPLLHIADVTAQAIKRSHCRINKVGLLSTRFTAERAFYAGRLRTQHGLDVLVPDVADRELVHRIIYDELCLGRIELASRRQLQRIVAQFAERGAQAVIFGCTEIALLLPAEQIALPVFDSTRLHADAAVTASLDD